MKIPRKKTQNSNRTSVHHDNWYEGLPHLEIKKSHNPQRYYETRNLTQDSKKNQQNHINFHKQLVF